MDVERIATRIAAESLLIEEAKEDDKSRRIAERLVIGFREVMDRKKLEMNVKRPTSGKLEIAFSYVHPVGDEKPRDPTKAYARVGDKFTKAAEAAGKKVIRAVDKEYEGYNASWSNTAITQLLDNLVFTRTLILDLGTRELARDVKGLLKKVRL